MLRWRLASETFFRWIRATETDAQFVYILRGELSRRGFDPTTTIRIAVEPDSIIFTQALEGSRAARVGDGNAMRPGAVDLDGLTATEIDAWLEREVFISDVSA